MKVHFHEWPELAIRWAHVFAGILWVGATFFFAWLDGRFAALEKATAPSPGEKKFVWMVHSGGFYAVEKQKIPPSSCRRRCIGSSGRRPSPGSQASCFLACSTGMGNC